jgi:hypothetical protein
MATVGGWGMLGRLGHTWLGRTNEFHSMKSRTCLWCQILPHLSPDPCWLSSPLYHPPVPTHPLSTPVFLPLFPPTFQPHGLSAPLVCSRSLLLTSPHYQQLVHFCSSNTCFFKLFYESTILSFFNIQMSVLLSALHLLAKYKKESFIPRKRPGPTSCSHSTAGFSSVAQKMAE